MECHRRSQLSAYLRSFGVGAAVAAGVAGTAVAAAATAVATGVAATGAVAVATVAAVAAVAVGGTSAALVDATLAVGAEELGGELGVQATPAMYIAPAASARSVCRRVRVVDGCSVDFCISASCAEVTFAIYYPSMTSVVISVNTRSNSPCKITVVDHVCGATLPLHARAMHSELRKQVVSIPR